MQNENPYLPPSTSQEEFVHGSQTIAYQDQGHVVLRLNEPMLTGRCVICNQTAGGTTRVPPMNQLNPFLATLGVLAFYFAGSLFLRKVTPVSEPTIQLVLLLVICAGVGLLQWTYLLHVQFVFCSVHLRLVRRRKVLQLATTCLFLSLPIASSFFSQFSDEEVRVWVEPRTINWLSGALLFFAGSLVHSWQYIPIRPQTD